MLSELTHVESSLDQASLQALKEALTGERQVVRPMGAHCSTSQPQTPPSRNGAVVSADDYYTA